MNIANRMQEILKMSHVNVETMTEINALDNGITVTFFHREIIPISELMKGAGFYSITKAIENFQNRSVPNLERIKKENHLMNEIIKKIQAPKEELIEKKELDWNAKLYLGIN